MMIVPTWLQASNIHEHWNKLTDDSLLENYLPPPVEDIDELGNAIDVGQDDVDFWLLLMVDNVPVFAVQTSGN